ncbi:MAG: PorV/PorQ family protein [Elusimicrobiaceae bacterium]|nr:PorV/PorQ family protein [Elusimicrobiaceae bacterium]
MINKSKTAKIAKKTAGLLTAFLLAAIGVAPPAGAVAFNSQAVGTTGADFLNLGVGGRAMGMGGAYTAVAENASAIYWNPAGLVQINRMSATFMQASYLADINYQYAAYAHRLNTYSVLACSIMMTDLGKIKKTDVEGTYSGETFTPRDQVFALAYSRGIQELSDRDLDISMGITAKYYTTRIVEQAAGVAFDLGVMGYYFSSIPYRLAFMLQNLGTGPKFDQERSPLPTSFKLGGSISPFPELLVSADVMVPRGNSPYGMIGAEYNMKPYDKTRLGLRAGVNTQQLGITGGTSGISMGIGLGMQFFNLDYAYVPMGELGSTHRFSLSFDFPLWTPVFQRRDRSIFNEVEQIASFDD